MPVVPLRIVLWDKRLPGLCEPHHPHQVHLSLDLSGKARDAVSLQSWDSSSRRGQSTALTWPLCRVSGFTFLLGTNPLFTRMVILE